MNIQSSAASESCLEVRSVVCERGFNALFDAVSFTVSPSSAVQITGANGSGKTTLLRSLAGLHQPVSGSILWNGSPIRDESSGYAGRIDFLGHKSGLNSDLTPVENLRFIQSFRRQSAIESSDPPVSFSIDTALKTTGAAQFAGLATHLLSAGQKQRVALARLLADGLDIWLLDEPATALDRAGIGMLEKIMSDHIDNGGIIVFTSHQSLDIGTGSVVTVELTSKGKLS